MAVQTSGSSRTVGLGGDWANRQWCLAVTMALVRPTLGHLAHWGTKGQAAAVPSTVVCTESMALAQEAGLVGVGQTLTLQQPVARQALAGKGTGWLQCSGAEGLAQMAGHAEPQGIK